MRKSEFKRISGGGKWDQEDLRCRRSICLSDEWKKWAKRRFNRDYRHRNKENKDEY